MRLDHLLSKENMRAEEALILPGQAVEVRKRFALFNLEGTCRKYASHISCPIFYLCPQGGIAQLGEHLLCKQGVVGSSPTISTRALGRWGLIAQLARAHD